MLRRLLVPTLALAVASAPAGAQQVDVESFTLDNGMEFLLVPRSDQPNNIAAGWMARVGSVNERPGITGISHFFEHMMFKGTDTIGTTDAQTDRKYREQLAAIRDQLLELQLGEQYDRWRRGEIDDPWDAKNDTPKIAALRAEMNNLTERQRETIVKDEFDRVYTNLGASGMNAFTSYDLTFYFITVPSNKFELWAWMESDRLLNSTFREFYAERDVVHEERRLRTESTPTGVFQEQLDSMFWMSSPYGWPVIGWTSDLNSYTRAEAERFYDVYYRPNNLVGVVVGDFDPAEAKTLIKSYFGRLERGDDPPKVVTLEMEQQAEMRMYAEGDFQPQVEVRYHTVPALHADTSALEVMSQILNRRTGRLYKAMVEGKEIASSAASGTDPRKYAGAFSFYAETKGDASPEDLEEAWYEVLADLQENLVSDAELQKVKNQFLANSYRRLQSNFFLLVQLGYYEALGEWEYLNNQRDMVDAVTAEDIKRVANTYFEKTNRTVAIYTREAGTQPEDPELLAMPPQARAMVKQTLARLEEVTIAELDMLRQQMSMMAAQAAQVPAEFQSAFDYILEAMREKIAELEAEEAGS